MKKGLIRSPPCRRHIALQVQRCRSGRSNWTAARAALLLVELLFFDTKLSLPSLQFKLSDLSLLLLERKRMRSKETGVLRLLELNVRLLNLELKTLRLAARLCFAQ